MAEYNIQMNQLSDSEYDKHYPYTYAELSNLSSSLQSMYRATTLDGALEQAYYGVGNYVYDITLLAPNGSPVSGITIGGVTTQSGGAAVTNSNGFVRGVSKNSTVTLTVTSPYPDINNISQRVTSTSLVTAVTLTLTAYTGIRIYTASGNATLSPWVTSVEYSVVGGGGSGAAVFNYGQGGATGGAGGYVVNGNRNITSNRNISWTIGAGGDSVYAGGTGNSRVGNYGIAGSSTTLIIGGYQFAANGGAGGGYIGVTGINGNNGGSGSGAIYGGYNNALAGTPGTDGSNGGDVSYTTSMGSTQTYSGGIGQGTSTRFFGTSTLCSTAGGGVAIGYTDTRYFYVTSGNARHLESSSYTAPSTLIGKSGTNYGDGGGAVSLTVAYTGGTSTATSGAGHAGCVALKFTHN